ncbi:hypothetical protein RKE29_05455 [Streptomyces sp. B1866]|uniref:hypothetical protein n=1 Tax=Streptomyces sp. B1866 TaxID=3075431 RepID=UPI00289070BB|nr:hypothetical protein [Streptomyces sp. B1866]MDT3396093.1 hypothetical protein [Streptomyces sp. B1866]
MSTSATDGKPAWGSGGSDRLKSDQAAWNAAGNGVGALQGNVRKARTELELKQQGLGGGSHGGVESAAAQAKVYDSWKRYLEDVGRRCGALREQLAKTGRAQDANDQATADAFRTLGGGYQDTPAVGGQSRDR